MEKQDKKGLIDKLQEKLTSRKLMVFIVATTFASLGKLPPDLWTLIATMYIGSQTLIDTIMSWKLGRKK